MLYITIPKSEWFDEVKSEFFTTKERTIQLEHSLVSLSKWESKWQKPFMSKDEKTTEEILDYIKCMTITQNVEPEIYLRIPQTEITKITEYIHAPMTATKISDVGNKINRDIITAEIIYYAMIALNIPFECQKWHLNRLITLINVCNVKNNPPKKVSKQTIAQRNKALNEERKKALGTSG